MNYFEKDDILHLAISDEPEVGSVEINPNITAEINPKGELIGIEILGPWGSNPSIVNFILKQILCCQIDHLIFK